MNSLIIHKIELISLNGKGARTIQPHRVFYYLILNNW